MHSVSAQITTSEGQVVSVTLPGKHKRWATPRRWVKFNKHKLLDLRKYVELQEQLINC